MRSRLAALAVCLISGTLAHSQDTTAPIIYGVTVGNITATSVTVTWATNELADGEVLWGTTMSYGSSRKDPSIVKVRTITLTGLSPSTVYQYRVRSRDAAGNLSASPNWNFKTAASADSTPPTIYGVTVGNITANSVTVTWATNENANGEVQWGTTTNYGASRTDSSLVTVRTVTLTGLSPSTVYQYRVRSRDAAGNLAASPNWNFKTAAATGDTTPPTVYGVTVGNITANSVTVTWATNENADGEVQWGTTVNYGSSRTDSAMVTVRTITLTGLSPSTVYQYRVRSRDAAGNLAASPNWNFQTAAGAAADTTPPALSAIAANSVSASGATIAWTTNEAADSEVVYGTSSAYGSSTGVNAAKVTGHSVALGGLSAGTTYHYAVRSRDAAGNLATSGDFTFTTAAPADTTPPVISAVATGMVTGTSVVVTWTTDEAADSDVDCGTTANFGGPSFLNPEKVTSHSVTMTGLTPGTQYYYRARSRDAAGNLALSPTFTVTTAAAAASDSTAPGVSGAAATGITASTATITWTTDEAADSQVEYGASEAYGSTSALDPAQLSGHSVSLAGLAPATLYHYRVLSRDAAGNLAVSADQTFTTGAADTPAGSAVNYASPFCDEGVPSGGYAWACGPWPATTPPALGGVNTRTSDPDTGNRVLRVTAPGSMGQTTSASFFTNYSGWSHDWAADDSALIVRSWGGDGGKFWVGFDPAAMSLTGASGRIPNAFAGDNFAFDETDPALIIGVQGSSVVSWNRHTNATATIFNLSAVSNVLTITAKGDRICVANGPQDSGYVVECFNRRTGVKQVINVRSQTINGAPYTITYKGGTTTQPGAGIHALTLGADGRWLAFDLHYTSGCTATGLNSGLQGLVLDLDTGNGYAWSLACGQTHWALGFDGAMVHGASAEWTSSGFNQADSCPSDDDRGIVMRTAGPEVDSSLRPLYCPPAPAGWGIGTHFSWQNNRDGANKNSYPVVGASLRHANGNKFLFNDIFAVETTQPAKQGRIWRFAQTWNDVKTANCDFLGWTSPVVARSGKFVAFPSNWMGQTGSGSCTNGKRVDVFVFELK